MLLSFRTERANQLIFSEYFTRVTPSQRLYSVQLW